MAPDRRHCRSMTNDATQPLFDHRLRERFFSQRVLVLDGVLDDDNGTVLATQLLSLASEAPTQGLARYRQTPRLNSSHSQTSYAALCLKTKQQLSKLVSSHT